MITRAAQSRRCGFTMVELLLGLALTALLMVGIGYALQASTQSVQANVQAMEARQQVNGGMDFMLNSIRQAQSITWKSANDLRIDLPPDASGNARWMEFVLSGNALMVKDQSTPASGSRSTGTVLMEGVKSLKFTAPPGKKEGDPPYKVTITLTATVPQGAGSGNSGQGADISLEATSVNRKVLRGQSADANANGADNANANANVGNAGHP